MDGVLQRSPAGEPQHRRAEHADRQVGQLAGPGRRARLRRATPSIRKCFDPSLQRLARAAMGRCSARSSCCAPPGRCCTNEHIRIDIVNARLLASARATGSTCSATSFSCCRSRSSCSSTAAVLHRSFAHQRAVAATPAGCRNGRPSRWSCSGSSLLFLQGISELIKRIAVMRGLIPDPHEQRGRTVGRSGSRATARLHRAR